MARSVRAGERGGHGRLTASLAIGAVYAVLAAVLWFTRQPSAALAIAGLGPLFLVFKHSFVRPSGHVEIYFRFVPLLVGLVRLFTRFDRRRWWAVAAPLEWCGARGRGDRRSTSGPGRWRRCCGRRRREPRWRRNRGARFGRSD
ncbi:MAG TPA: hypothetical protein VN442_20250 [Bryobacteraceae bacterium]|nr:hypothetical protein [Bryobacteraceae bacterium]